MKLEVLSEHPHEKIHPTPVLLVPSAKNHRVSIVSEERRTAKAYQTEPILYPDTAHDMMLEAGWKAVADQILSWRNTRGL